MASASCDPRFGSLRSSVRFVSFIVYPYLIGNPVDFPCLAAIFGERLFKMSGISCDVRPNVANQDSSTVKGLLIEKFTAPILELSYRGLAQDTILAVGPIETPLVRLGIVQTKGQTFDVAGRAVGFELLELCAAIPHLSGDRSAVKFDPRSGSG